MGNGLIARHFYHQADTAVRLAQVKLTTKENSSKTVTAEIRMNQYILYDTRSRTTWDVMLA